MKANIQVNHFDLGQIKPKINDKIKAPTKWKQSLLFYNEILKNFNFKFF